MAALYRACDVLVHPYRGEGFAMPVLEAMACGLPAIVTAGGPTDEFLPDDAGWRIDARQVWFAEDRIDTLETRGRPWLLEPDRAHLVALLRQADAADDDALQARGRAGRARRRELLVGRGGRALPGADHRPGRAPSPVRERGGARSLPARGGGRAGRARHPRVAAL